MTGGQLGFEDMPRRLFRATPTKLATWQDCPRRYRFTYLDRPTPTKGPPWAHNSVGASAHTALANWWREPEERRTPETAGELLDRAWLTDGFRDDEQRDRWQKVVRGWVEGYVRGLDPHDQPVGVERTVSVVTDRLALSGRVDRIDERSAVEANRLDDEDDEGEDEGGSEDEPDGGEPDPELAGRRELVIVDYKTGRRPLSTDDARGSFPLAVYAAASWRTLRRRAGRVELHHLPSGRVVSWYHQPDKLKRQLERADRVGAEAAEAEGRYAEGLSPAELDEVFPPRPSPMCSWCDFAPSCAEGRSAYPPHQPWGGLDPEI